MPYAKGVTHPFCYVYFVQEAESGHIKIGYAEKPKDRMAQLQTGNPRTLTLIGTMPSYKWAEEEAWHHKTFASERIDGEWFRQSEKLLSHIKNHTSQYLYELGETPETPEQFAWSDGYKSGFKAALRLWGHE
jgi:predicted GIY-YIG superfamily endonuclease